MRLRRVQAKYFVANSAAVDLPAVVPVFHSWIQQQRVDEMLIDVADYKHVHEGPGIVLIGHEADYALDIGRGRPGLRYSRKRLHDGGLRAGLRTVLRQALLACALLEDDASLDGLAFRTDEVEIAFPDRLLFPNEPATLERVRDDLEAVLAEYYGEVAVQITSVEEDPRQPFTVQVHIPDAADLADLLERLQTESV